MQLSGFPHTESFSEIQREREKWEEQHKKKEEGREEDLASKLVFCWSSRIKIEELHKEELNKEKSLAFLL